MGKTGFLLAVYSLAFTLIGARSDIKTLENYDFSEKFICPKTMSLYLDRAVLMKFSDNYLKSWPGNSDFECKMNLYSKTSETGIIAVIQELNFRKQPMCVDRVRFDIDATDRCGEIVFGLKKTSKGNLPPPPAFVSRYSGLFVRGNVLYLEDYYDSSGRISQIDSRRAIVSPGAVVQSQQKLQTIVHVHGQPQLASDEELHFTIAYTGFQDCERSNVTEELFNCGYGVCILAVYVNDGVVNCPFGDCKDEGSCEEAMATSLLLKDNRNTSAESEDVALRFRKSEKAVALTGGKSMVDFAMRTSETSHQITEEVKNIREEFVKQNAILGHLTDVIEKATSPKETVEGLKIVNQTIEMVPAKEQ